MEHISLDNYHFSILAKIYDKPYIPFTELAASYPPVTTEELVTPSCC